jgi:hypothetical protein
MKNKILKFLGEGALIILSVLIAFLIDEYRKRQNVALTPKVTNI